MIHTRCTCKHTILKDGEEDMLRKIERMMNSREAAAEINLQKEMTKIEEKITEKITEVIKEEDTKLEKRIMNYELNKRSRTTLIWLQQNLTH